MASVAQPKVRSRKDGAARPLDDPFGDFNEDFDDPRFLGAGPPFGAWLGVRIRL